MPVEIKTARGVARERGDEVAVRQHRLAGPQGGQDGRLDAMAEVDRMQQRVFPG